MTQTTPDELKEEVLRAACAWYGADIYVHPYLSRAEAVHEAEMALEKAVQNWNASQQACEAKNV